MSNTAIHQTSNSLFLLLPYSRCGLQLHHVGLGDQPDASRQRLPQQLGSPAGDHRVRRAHSHHFRWDHRGSRRKKKRKYLRDSTQREMQLSILFNIRPYHLQFSPGFERIYGCGCICWENTKGEFQENRENGMMGARRKLIYITAQMLLFFRPNADLYEAGDRVFR